MRAINQRALLFTYQQDIERPANNSTGTQTLEIFNNETESNVQGGVVTDVKFGNIISLSIYPPVNRRVLTPSGYIVKPMHDVETYRTQIVDNIGFRFMYIPDIRGGFQSGIYRIHNWDYIHSMTTGGKNKVTLRAEFIDTSSFIVPNAKIDEEYNKKVSAAGLRDRRPRAN